MLIRPSCLTLWVCQRPCLKAAWVLGSAVRPVLVHRVPLLMVRARGVGRAQPWAQLREAHVLPVVPGVPLFQWEPQELTAQSGLRLVAQPGLRLAAQPGLPVCWPGPTRVVPALCLPHWAWR